VSGIGSHACPEAWPARCCTPHILKHLPQEQLDELLELSDDDGGRTDEDVDVDVVAGPTPQPLLLARALPALPTLSQSQPQQQELGGTQHGLAPPSDAAGQRLPMAAGSTGVSGGGSSAAAPASAPAVVAPAGQAAVSGGSTDQPPRRRGRPPSAGVSRREERRLVAERRAQQVCSPCQIKRRGSCSSSFFDP